MSELWAMKTTIAVVAMVWASALMAQTSLPRTDEQNQRIKRGVFLRAGILGAAGLCATQSGNPSLRGAGWATFAGSAAGIFTVQIAIGDRVSDEAKRRKLYFLKTPY